MNWLPCYLLALACGLMLVACQSPAGLDAEPIPPSAEPTLLPAGPTLSVAEPALNVAFTVKAGHKAVIDDEQLRIKFDAVLEDSRCPTQVSCVWTGQARIAVVVQHADGEPVPLEFNTNPAPAFRRDTATYLSYEIRLITLDPYPRYPNNPIRFEDYVATFVVSAR